MSTTYEVHATTANGSTGTFGLAYTDLVSAAAMHKSVENGEHGEFVDVWIKIVQTHCEPTGRYLRDGRDVLVCGNVANPAGYCCEHGSFVRTQPQGDPVATDRREDEPCQRGTVGCSVDHQSESSCQTW